MSNGLVALMMSLGVGGWVYAKASRRLGGNVKSALIGSTVVGVIVFIITITLLGALDKYLSN